MKTNIFKTVIVAIAFALGLNSCGEKFLDAPIYEGVDIETALNTTENIGIALNGTYYRLFYYTFAGNYAISIGDVISDISYWNRKTNHWNDFYQLNYEVTSSYLSNIWAYGYKVVDNSARIIQAANELLPTASEDEAAELNLYLGEAHSLRAYAMFMLTNIFGHQVKVNGQDFGSSLGVVVVDKPISPLENVKRNTVAECYAQIISDYNKALECFEQAGGDRGDQIYIGQAAASGLLARAYLYNEDWANAIDAANKALTFAGENVKVVTDSVEYRALFNGGPNAESFFSLGITSKDNWSANSCGTLYTTYNFSPSPYLLSLYDAKDIRRGIMGFAKSSTAQVPVYSGGKFQAFESENPAYGTNHIIGVAETNLILAEAIFQRDNKVDSAFLKVAKRNPNVKAENYTPDTFMDSLKVERARELFQEGHRLWDLRRWGDETNVSATNAPAIKYAFENVKLGDLVFPIPEDEINANFGVIQNDGWEKTRPSK